MHRHKFTLWCWTFLLVAFCESWGNFMTTNNDKRNNSTVRYYETYSDVTMTDRSDNEEFVRHNMRENSPKNNNYDDIQDEFHAHSMKNHEGGNQMPTELRAKSTKANDRNSSMNLHELRRNVRQAEDRSNLTLYEFQGKLYEDDITVPYEMCENSTCVLLCCPLGSRIKATKYYAKCTTENANYPFPDLYYYEPVTNDSWERIPFGKKLDQVFLLSVHDPCNFTRYLIQPDIYPEHEYTILDDGTLYLPRMGDLIESYCFAVMYETDKYNIIVCADFEDEEREESLWYDENIKNGCRIASLLFFLVTFLVYSMLPELRNTHGYIVRAYVASLSVAYIFSGILRLGTSEPLSISACIASGFITYFSFLASFFWLNVMCFDIWWTFGRLRLLQENKRERKKLVMYSIYAWGSASLLTILCAIMDFVPGVPQEWIRPEFVEFCGLYTYQARLLYYYVPVSVTVICNICLFISTVLKLVRHKKDTQHHLRGSESRRNDDNKQRFNLCLKLLFVMGVNWSWEISYGLWLFEYSRDSILFYVRYIIDLISTLQGLFIFIIFIWRERIKWLLLKRFKLSRS